MIGETEVRIARRFRGPPESGNGGSTCGLLARYFEAGVRVRLNSPPPLDEPLLLRPGEADSLALVRGEAVIGEARPDVLVGDVPSPVSFDEAVEASKNYRWWEVHPYPGCFVCGPHRHRADGLCIYPGHVEGRQLAAAPWIPDASLADAAGVVHTEVAWATLDCPSWFGVLESEDAVAIAPLLGQLTGRLLRRPLVDEPCVAIGWSRGREGRKFFAGAALYTASGELLGHSETIWVAPRM